MKICLIGNSGTIKRDKGGQTTKVRLYAKKIVDEGCELFFVDLEEFKKKPLSTLHKIKKGICNCDRVVLISSTNGCKFLIPFINRINKKRKIPFILPLVGTSVLHYSLDRLSVNERIDFLCNGHYDIIKPRKSLCKSLSRITYILPETDHLTRFFSEYYSLNNCMTLNNFREVSSIQKVEKLNDGKNLFVVFLSRITNIKGIFDLINVINSINDVHKMSNIKLSIYGELELNKMDTKLFYNSLNESIIYKGSIDNDLVIKELSKYDLFIFPTRAIGEGTPGVISEAFLAGVPVLSSNFPQAKLLLKNDYNSSLFRMFDIQDLKNKLTRILLNREYLNIITAGAIKTGHDFDYESERSRFLKYICGFYDKQNS